MVGRFAKRGLDRRWLGDGDQGFALYLRREKFPYSGKQATAREIWLARHLESLGFASLFASRAIWLQRGQRNESMVLPAFPLVHSLSRLCRQSQLSCQRLYCFRFFFYRRGNFPAKNRPIRPRHEDLALGGLVFPHLSDRLLLACCVCGKPVSGAGFGLDSGCNFGAMVVGWSPGCALLDDAA